MNTRQRLGWAVSDRGGICVRSVSPTRRGAIINWLHVVAGLRIWDHDTDEHVESLWDHTHEPFKAEVHEVSVKRRSV